MSKMNCPHCKVVFETSERLLRHFVDSPDCFQRTVSLAGIDDRSGKQLLTPTAANPLTCRLTTGFVMSRRTLVLVGLIVVAVSMAMSAVVALSVGMWFNTHGLLKETVGTPVFGQTVKPQAKATGIPHSSAFAASQMQPMQVSTSVPPASVANPSNSPVSQQANSATNITLNLTPSRTSIHLGESFNLTIEVNGADQSVAAPDLSALPPSDVLFLGQHSNNRSSISIINGKMTRESLEGRVFSYKITPQTQGVYHTGPVRVIAAGKTYSHPGVTVDVAGVPGT